MSNITIDFAKNMGPVKPFNCVNNGPVSVRSAMSNYDSWKDLEIPYARLHDASFCSHYGGEWTVDVHRIFRDFDADENDPANYIFAPTDRYLQSIESVGTKVYYRLGASIEHQYQYGTRPPKDFEKWARICEHIIRHYTEGWADGFFMDIEYWEIWNEPENINAGKNPCWQGTQEEFGEFFSVVYKYLKSVFPNLKIGGPAIATVRHKEQLSLFLSILNKNGVRPDFFSYHRYTPNMEDFVQYVREANDFLERYGLGDVETHINEWNYIRGWSGDEFIHSVKSSKGIKGAAFLAASMCVLHPEKLDMLMYYDARPDIWCGLWDTDYLTNLKGYYSFLAFSALRKLGTAVYSECDDYVYSLGAIGDDGAAVLFSHFEEPDGAQERHLTLSLENLPEGCSNLEYYILDEDHDLELVRSEQISGGRKTVELDLPPYTCYLLKIKKA